MMIPSRELSTHFLCIRGWFAGKTLQTNVWKIQNATGCFLARLHVSIFFCNILCLVPKVSNS